MSVLDSYQRKARITTTMLNSLEGVSCNAVTGSLYALPKIVLPQKAIEEAMVRHQRGLVSILYYGIFPPFTQKPTAKIWLHLEFNRGQTQEHAQCTRTRSRPGKFPARNFN